MILSLTQFKTVEVFNTAPRLLEIASEQQDSPKYHLRGRLRSKEAPRAIFKYSLSGEGVIEDKDGPHKVPESHGFLCEVTDPEISYYYPEDGTRPWEFIWIGFDGESAFKWVREIIGKYGRVYHLPKNSEIIKRLCVWRSEKNAQKIIQASFGIDLINTLLLSLIESKEKKANLDSSAALFRQVQEFVAEKVNENLNAKMIAGKLKVSREHLSRIFHKEAGLTLHKYIVDQKMRYACHLLRHSSLRGKEIAEKLGYESPTHFTRTFKRIMSSSPQQYRRSG